jgi:hypothetical protein
MVLACAGPSVGPHMAYHLGGGEGGIRHYLDHLGPSQVRRWESLGTPRFDDAAKEALVQGIEEEAAGRSIPELEAQRDALLLRLLKAKQEAKAS